MSSRSKNFRRRSVEDADGDEKSPSTSTGRSGGGQTLARPKPKPRSLLSFADEEEEGPTRPRPSKPSSSSSKHNSAHILSSSKERAINAASTALKPSIFQSQSGEYTTEKLRELQKNARPLGGAAKVQILSVAAAASPEPPKPAKAEAPGEPVIVLKGLEGLVKTVVVQEKDGKGELGVEEVEEKGEVETRRFAGLGIDAGGRDSSLIPDKATIAAIRAKRERLRQSRSAAPDYISLDTGGAVRSAGGGSSDEEEDDLHGRVALLGDSVGGVSKKGVFESIDERAVLVERTAMDGRVRGVAEEEEDDEDRIWEEEQFRKGLGKRLDESSSHIGTNGTVIVPAMQPLPSAYSAATLQLSSSSVNVEAALSVTRGAEFMSMTQQAEVATRALKENIGRVRETHSRTLSSLVRTDENISEALSNITTLEKSLVSADNKFVFMQKLRDFISVICSFLQDKAPYIEELEEQMQKLHEDRALAVTERRAADNADEMAEVEAAVTAAISVLSKGSSAALISAAATAAQAAATTAKESFNLPVQLDEFGRDLNRQKRLDLERRTEARKRRKARSESKRMLSIRSENVYQQIEGESSTDESDSETSAYQSSRDELLQTAEQVFSDASDEYSKLSVVKERFEEWKKYYSASYRDAYMSLSVPLIFSPYVRLELLKWDPLYTDSSFHDMEWHSQLFEYGIQENEKNFNPDDPDNNLVPELVESIALPILHHEIAHCWDILSTRMTKNAISATNLVISYIQPSSVALCEMLDVVRSRLSETITNLIVPTWNTSVIRAVPDAAHIAAYRFGTSVRLLKNICLWKDILTLSVLEELALEKLLSGKILPHLRSAMPNIHDAVTRTERVVASLSGVWSGPSVTEVRSQKLQPLVDCVAELSKRLEKRHASGVGEDTVGIARRLKKVLVELNEYDKARAILRTFQLREAL